VVTDNHTLPQHFTFSSLSALKSAFSGADVPVDIRSRRTSSLAPGPETPSATPFRDARHGSETAPRFSWRATAAVLQARARRFSSSSTANRPSERHSAEAYRDHELSAASQSQRIDSNESTAFAYADVLDRKSTQQRGLHKDSHDFANPVNLTPQSVISAVHAHSTRTTPSDVVVCVGHGQAQKSGCSSALQKELRTPGSFVAHFEAAAQLAAAPQSVTGRHRMRSVPHDTKCQHRVRRALSTVAKRVPSAPNTAHDYISRRSCSHAYPGALFPSAQSLSRAAKEKSFQRMVPHGASMLTASQPGLEGNGAVVTDGQHCPPPLPSNEIARQEALEALNILQEPPAAALHDIAACAASAFQVPVVVITLIGNKTVWCQTQSGQAGFQGRQLCVGAWTLLSPKPEVMVVPDCLTDFRSITDMQPRDLDAQGQSLLTRFAGMAVRQLEQASLAKSLAHQAYIEGHAAALCNATRGSADPAMLCDISNQQHWRILAVNPAWVAASGICREHAEGSLLWDVFYAPDMGPQPVAQMCMESAARQTTFNLQLASQLDHQDRLTIKTLDFRFRPTVLQSSADSVAQSFYYATIRDLKKPAHQCSDEASPIMLLPVPGTIAETEPFTAVNLGPLLGQGGSGHVYRGTWNGATVAVKVVEALHAKGDESGAPLKPLEAMLSIDLAHPNIIHTYKFYTRIRQGHARPELQSADTAERKVSETWMVLEFCSKGSLQDALDRHACLGWFRSRKAVMDGSADLEAIIITATEIASAMAYLHSLDILHGDLSSNNVLLACNSDDQRGFTAKVADFGLARMLPQGETIETHAIGTITHMPPELMLEGSLSQAVDVYAFGVVLWEMYTGQRPWAGMRHAQIVHTICGLEQQLEFPYGTPARFKELGLACMHPDADERPSFSQIVATLDELTVLAAEDPLEMMSEGYPMHIL
ncbi:MAG: kinase, partial [Trebouxia sp. A1-2]